MGKLNNHYKKLKREYIFPIIDKKLAELKARCPDAQVLNFGVGDICLPLVPSIAEAICGAVQEMTTLEGMRGYGPSEGYLFLREAIAKNLFSPMDIAPDEIFISDGANTDTSNIQELFSLQCIVGVTDPTYPVYLDTNIMAGRASKIIFLPCTEKTGLCAEPPPFHCDIVYLCSPGNPSGVAMNRAQMRSWVDYAHREKGILLLDNAYDAFITSSDVPKTIFEIEGAKEVAIEFRSFSKSAGFTGLRCAYSVVPKQVLQGKLYPLWMKRQTIKSNGLAYPIQRGAQAYFSLQGQQETKAQIAHYLQAAKILREGLKKSGFICYGGIDSPYIWWKTPAGLSSWQFFDHLLEKCHLVSIPGKGFGENGEGFVRLSAFNSPENASLAVQRICALQ